MRKLNRFAAAVVWIIAGIGCTVEQAVIDQITPTADPTAAITQTAALPEVTASAAVTETSLPTPGQTSGQVQAVVTAQGVFLRNGPGTLFEPRKLLDLDTSLTVLGRARGDDWLLVETGGVEGWISVSFARLQDDLSTAVLPVHNPNDVITVRGQVTDSFGGPVEGVTFAVMQNSAAGVLRTDATTRKDGFFYAYLPVDSSGTWRVALTGVDCKSPIVNGECSFNGQFVPTWKDIELPVSELITFQYISQ
jgi:protocatechuate 3,4-dioxygenase beta subunit